MFIDHHYPRYCNINRPKQKYRLCQHRERCRRWNLLGPTCTNKTLSLEWGLMEAGSNNILTVYIKNECNSAVSLSLGTSNWTPSVSLDYLSLSWNYSGQVLSVGQVITLKLTLTIDPAINGVSNFSFDTIITASER